MELINFRDIGGITTRLGKIKEKRLLRSGELFQLSDADAKTLEYEYNLKLILDLRSPNEYSKRPDVEINGARYLNLDIMRDLTDDNTGFETVLTQLDLNIVDEHMKDVYRKIITDHNASLEYCRFMNEIANLEEGSALFHCYAGKDRTGFGATLLLDTLGASKDVIYVDYMMTNTMREEANTVICNDAAQKYNLSASQTEALRQFLLVKESYIDEAYRVIDELFGSIENYIIKGLGVMPETLEKIRVNYLD